MNISLDSDVGVDGSSQPSENFQDPKILQRLRMLSLEGKLITRWLAYCKEHMVLPVSFDKLSEDDRTAYDRIEEEVNRDVISYLEEISSGPTESGGRTLDQRIRIAGLQGQFNGDMLAVMVEGERTPGDLSESQRAQLKKLEDRRDLDLANYLVEIGVR